MYNTLETPKRQYDNLGNYNFETAGLKDILESETLIEEITGKKVITSSGLNFDFESDTDGWVGGRRLDVDTTGQTVLTGDSPTDTISQSFHYVPNGNGLVLSFRFFDDFDGNGSYRVKVNDTYIDIVTDGASSMYDGYQGTDLRQNGVFINSEFSTYHNFHSGQTPYYSQAFEIIIPERLLDGTSVDVEFQVSDNREWGVDDIGLRPSGYNEMSEHFLSHTEASLLRAKIENLEQDSAVAADSSNSLWNHFESVLGNTGLKGQLNEIQSLFQDQSFGNLPDGEVIRLSNAAIQSLNSWADENVGFEQMSDTLWNSYEDFISDAASSVDALKLITGIAALIGTGGALGTGNVPGTIAGSMGSINLLASVFEKQVDEIDLPPLPFWNNETAADAFIFLGDELENRGLITSALEDAIANGFEAYADFMANARAASIISEMDVTDQNLQGLMDGLEEIRELGFEVSEHWIFPLAGDRRRVEIRDGERDLAEDINLTYRWVEGWTTPGLEPSNYWAAVTDFEVL